MRKMTNQNRADSYGRSMYASIIGAIIFAFIVFGLVAGVIGLYSFNKEFRNENAVATYHMADAAVALVNGDHIEDYLGGLEKEEYEQTREALASCCRRMNVSLIYVIKVDRSDYGRFVSIFNLVNNTVDDTSYTEWELGYRRDTTNDEYRQKYRAVYEEGSPYETVYRGKTTDGQHPHITTMVPVRDSSGNVAAILCMQRPIREIIDAARPYLVTVAVSTLLIAAVASLIAAAYTRDGLLEPVSKVSEEASRFAREKSIGEPLGQISDFTEIRDLADSIDTMEKDMTGYMEELTAVTSARERISAELSLAGQIQQNSVPGTFPAFPDRSDFEIYGFMSPAREVGGDFYNYFLLDDDHLMICIGDVSGKGIPGALFMMVTTILVSDRTRMGGSPAEILTAVNRELCGHNSAQMFVTIWLGILQLSTGILKACNAGHEYPILKQAGGRYELIKDRHGLVVAAMEDTVYRDYVLQLSPGSRLFLYTDGVPEAASADGEMFGTARTVEALNQGGTASAELTVRNVREAVEGFASGTEQFDDLAMLCLEYRGSGEPDSLELEAALPDLNIMQEFIDTHLETAGWPEKARMPVRLAAEEIFVNIAQYAYAPESGKVRVEIEVTEDPPEITLKFTDSGIPYDPLAKADPDISLPAEEREIGGLGIYMTKKFMDDLSYEYRDGQNILVMKKRCDIEETE